MKRQTDPYGKTMERQTKEKNKISYLNKFPSLQIPQTLTLRFSVSSRGEYIENGSIGLYGWRFMKKLAEA